MVAEDVFAHSPYLLVHKQQLLGRDFDEVDRYDLVTNDGKCSLVYASTNARRPIPELDCEIYNAD